MAQQKQTEIQNDEMRKAFDNFDKNGNGTITKKEFKKAMRKLGYNPTKGELKTMLQVYDKDDSGKIDFAEFSSLMAMYSSEHPDPQQELHDAFKVFDKNGDGYVTAKELRKAMKKLGDKMSEKDCEMMIEKADVDNDGRINHEEFTKWLMNMNLQTSKPGKP